MDIKAIKELYDIAVATGEQQSYDAFHKAFENQFPVIAAELEELHTFVNELYEECPDLKNEGLSAFKGYYTTWDEIIRCFKEYDPNVSWNDSPKELLVDLIDECAIQKQRLSAAQERVKEYEAFRDLFIEWQNETPAIMDGSRFYQEKVAAQHDRRKKLLEMAQALKGSE